MNRTNGRRVLVAVSLIVLSSVAIEVAHRWHVQNKRKEALRDPFPDESLESLYAQLEVPGSLDSWMLAMEKMAAKSSRIGEQARSQTVEVIKRFIERKEPGGTCESHQDKGMALELLGEMGGPEACALLRSAFTEDGARELTKAWPKPMAVNPEYTTFTIVNIRGRAAVGLACAGSEDDMNIVRVEYERIAKQLDYESRYYKPCPGVASIPKYSPHQRGVLFDYLVDSLARRDLYEDKGKGVLGGGDAAAALAEMSPYLDKYNVPKHEP